MNSEKNFGIPQSVIESINEIRKSKKEDVSEASSLPPVQPGKRIAKAPKNAEKEYQKTKKRLAKWYPNVKPSERSALEHVEDAESCDTELNELSRKTLGSYLRKADKKQAQKGENMIKRDKKFDNDVHPLVRRSQGLASRQKSISLAAKKYHTANESIDFLLDISDLLHYIKESDITSDLNESETNHFDSLLEQLDALIEATQLDEGRPKGSKNKAKTGAAPAPKSDSKSTETKKSDDEDDEDEDESPSYPEASGKDVPHIMSQMSGAIDAGGRHVVTSKGPKYVSKGTAQKVHNHLMSLKPSDRAAASAKIYNMDSSHPMVKHIQSDHEESVKKGIAVPKMAKGRGRPKKSA